MATFGEVVLESSRAFPDDEEEDERNQASITFEGRTDAEETLRKLASTGDVTAYMFAGKVACGFGNGFLNDQFQFLGAVYYGGFEGIVDSLLRRPERRPIVRLYSGPGRFVFAVIDTYGLPRSLSNEVVQAISFVLDTANTVVIFHSEPITAFRGDEDVQGRLFHIRSTAIQQASSSSSIFRAVSVLPQPNIISGVSAAVMTQLEASERACLLLVTYCETELIDSISVRPFIHALEKGNSGTINLMEHFSALTYNSDQSTRSNSTAIRNSNLYT